MKLEGHYPAFGFLTFLSKQLLMGNSPNNPKITQWDREISRLIHDSHSSPFLPRRTGSLVYQPQWLLQVLHKPCLREKCIVCHSSVCSLSWGWAQLPGRGKSTAPGTALTEVEALGVLCPHSKSGLTGLLGEPAQTNRTYAP